MTRRHSQDSFQHNSLKHVLNVSLFTKHHSIYKLKMCSFLLMIIYWRYE